MNLRNALRKLMAFVLAIAMTGTVLPISANEDLPGTIVYVEDGLTRLLQISQDQGVVLHEDDEVVRVSIILEKSATTQNYSSEAIATNAAAKAYRSTLAADQKALEDRISREVLDGRELDVAWNLTLSANLISAYVPYGKIAEIKKMDGVKDVVLEAKYNAPKGLQADKPMMLDAGPMVNAGVAYADGYTGAGSAIAVIDTGTDTDHQSFDESAYLYAMEEDAKTEEMTLEEYQEAMGVLTKESIEEVLPGTNAYQKKRNLTVDDVYLSAKLPFAFNYVDNNLNVTHDTDSQGEHGSHVAGIAAANRYIPTEDGFVNALDEVMVQGIAPEAQILTMKVFGTNGGAYDSDYMAALEDALYLGAASSNLSLGTSNAGMTSAGEYEELMDSFTQTSMVVSIAAGNAYAWNEFTPYGYLYGDDVSFNTVGSPGSYNNSLAVASIENAGLIGRYFSVNDVNVFYQESGTSFTNLAEDLEYVVVPGVGASEDYEGIAANVSGRIALVSRGEISFVEKATNAVENGAIGIIIYNNEKGVVNMSLEGFSGKEPVIAISQADGQMMVEAAKESIGQIKNHTDLGHFTADKREMSNFSSWGATGALVLKPEITAPGGNIYSVNGSVRGGTAYESMSGTSMATPQVAGMAALLRQYVRANNLSEKLVASERSIVNALLMSTAKPVMEEDAGSWYSVMKTGAGLADVGAAINAKALLFMTEDSVLNPISAGDGKIKAEFGDDPERSGVYTYHFMMFNMTDHDHMYTLDTDVMTQNIFTEEEQSFLDTQTKAIGANAKYTINGVTFTPEIYKEADVNKDGVTDKKDAKAVLAYATGAQDGAAYDLLAADFDGDGSVTSYDAHMILVSIENAWFKLPAEGVVDIDVEITLDEETKQMLNEDYVNGAYVEGYTWIKPVETEEGELDEEYSIPFLGFYGSYGEAGMYDKGGNLVDFYYDLEGNPENMNPSPYTAETMFREYETWIGNTIVIDGMFHQLNPFGIESEKHLERAALDSSSDVLYNVALIRNAGATLTWAEDLEGNVVAESDVSFDQYGRFYHPEYGWIEIVGDEGYYFGQLGARLKDDWGSTLKQGDGVVFKTLSIPENFTYLKPREEITPSYMRSLVSDGLVGEENVLTSYPFTIDNESPSVSGAELVTNEEGGHELKSVAHDNEYVAGAALIDFSPWFEMSLIRRFLALVLGETMFDYAEIAEIQYNENGEKGQDVEFAFAVGDSIETIEDAKYLAIDVMDYASHETIYTFSKEVARRLSGDNPEEKEYTREEMIEALGKEGIEIPEKKKLDISGATNVVTTVEPVVEEEVNTVVVDVKADGDTNCLSEITYDASLLKLESIASGQEVFMSCEDDGKVVFAFANATEVNDIIATVKFKYEPTDDEAATVVHVSTKEQNDGIGGEEEVRVVIPDKEYEPEIEIVGEGIAELSDRTLHVKAEEGHTLESISSDGQVILAFEGSSIKKASDGRGEFTLAVNGENLIVTYRKLDLEFIIEDDAWYWYENGVRQGTIQDEKNIKDTQFGNNPRGREIYDPTSKAWYWLDVVLGGAIAREKEVWIPYVFQDEEPGSTSGKWVRYDKHGQMIKGWYANDNGVYYYDLETGAMYKGTHVIHGKTYHFDEITGIMY